MEKLIPFGLLYIILLLACLVVPPLWYMSARREKAALDALQRQADDEMDKDDYKKGNQK
jgi:hypothetical protein